MRLPTGAQKKKGGGVASRASVSLNQKAMYFLCKSCSLSHIPGPADYFLLKDPNKTPLMNGLTKFPVSRLTGVESDPRLISIGCAWKGCCIKDDLGQSPPLDAGG